MLTDGKSGEASKCPSVKPGNDGSRFLPRPANPRLAAQALPGLSVGLWAGILRHPQLLQTARMLWLVVISFPILHPCLGIKVLTKESFLHLENTHAVFSRLSSLC